MIFFIKGEYSVQGLLHFFESLSPPLSEAEEKLEKIALQLTVIMIIFFVNY